jgi:deoxyguanosine kinase
MNLQNQVLLSIGSNVGDRLKAITDCISLLHKTSGTIICVSDLYETPSWGFDSDDFYNCVVLMHTHKDVNTLWASLLQSEKQLGRDRKAGEGYQARTIDIDIIDFNGEIINTADLTIPHPKMHQRRFVLQPLKDVSPDYAHPEIKLVIDRLLSTCGDDVKCKFISRLSAPLSKYSPENFNYIAIEGNIGAGKTTLATKISEDFNAKLVLERFADNPFLPKFYKDQQRYAFPLEMSFLADRYQQLSDDLAQFDLFKDFIVADYHIFKSLIFANVTLTEDENRLYRKLFEIIYKEMPKPGLYIYLYQNTERLLQNIKKRGRSYEQEIPAEYLDKINRGYLDYIKSQTELNVIVIDVSDKDFVENQEDYLAILDAIGAA